MKFTQDWFTRNINNSVRMAGYQLAIQKHV